MKSLLVLIALGIALIASESVPSWYFNPPSDNETSWYGVGEGSTLRQAKDSALADIASRLSVTISSKVSKNATQTSTGAFSSYNQNVNVNQESEVKKIAFNNFEVVSTSQNDSKALVLVEVDKAKFLKDQLQTLTDTVNDINGLQPKGKSILEQYQELKSMAPDVEKAKTILSILTTFEIPFDRTKMAHAVSDYRDSLDTVRSKIEFYISADNDSRYSADVLKEALATEKIKIAQRFNRNNSNLVIINLDTEATTKQLFNTYMVNTRTTVSLKSKEGATISTFIVESRGNSSIDYATALKNASNNFKQQVNEKGIFTFLGIN